MNKEELLSDLAEITKHLTTLRESFAQHILASHAGVPIMTCDSCMQMSYSIRTGQINIDAIQQDLETSNSSEQ